MNSSIVRGSPAKASRTGVAALAASAATEEYRVSPATASQMTQNAIATGQERAIRTPI